MKEIWKDISGYENLYQVSNLGRIRSTPRNGTKGGQINLIEINHYFKVRLYKNGKRKCFFVHRLVAQAFIPNPLNKPQINHKDGIKTNNCVDNLEWATCQENIEHAYSHGLGKSREILQMKNGEIIEKHLNIRRASLKTGITYSSIYWCVNGILKTAGGFEWKFAHNDL